MVKSKRAIVLTIILILAIPVSYGVAASPVFQIYLPLIYKNVPPTSTRTPTPTKTPSFTAIPTNTATPTATQTQPPHNTGNVVITTIFYDGSGPNEPDEYVEIRNDDTFSIQLVNWTLRDEANHIFTFPSFVIQVGQVCRIYTNENHPEWCGFDYHSGSAIWNNTGDCGYLRDSSNTLINQYCY